MPSITTDTTPVDFSEHDTIFRHPDLSEKTKRICEVARKADYKLVWIDACCINQDDPAELSEAINSMYEWYKLSHICYVYLADVPDGHDPTLPDSFF